MSDPQATPPPVDYTDLAPTLPEGPMDFGYFGAQWADIEIEIGFGRGMFLIQRAQQVPDHLLLGFEVKKKLAYQVDQRCRRLGLHGVFAMFADAREALPRLKPDGRVARVFMHFPDPWWKKRHGKRRLIGEALLAEVARLLRPGGEYFVQTDVEERAVLHAETLRCHPAFSVEPATGYWERNPYGAVSNREQRAIEDGLPVFRVLGRRR